jgi:hypothetical protein
VLGPYIKAFDENLFSLPWFVKHTEPKDWPKKMDDLFGTQTCMETDFSAFESHHHGVMSKISEYVFNHSMRKQPSMVRRALARFVRQTNVCVNKAAIVSVKERLMSGALWTSSMNGLMNLLIMMYHQPGTYEDKIEQFVGLVEGDDGIFLKKKFDPEVTSKLGVNLDFKEGMYTELSFCGINCCRGGVINYDYQKLLANFHYLDSKTKGYGEKKQKALMRAKALSMKYLFGNSPVVGPFCDNVLKLTSGYLPKSSETYGKYSYVDKCTDFKAPAKVDYQSRVQYSKVFGLSIQQQLLLESCFVGNQVCVPATCVSDHLFFAGLNYVAHTDEIREFRGFTLPKVRGNILRNKCVLR